MKNNNKFYVNSKLIFNDLNEAKTEQENKILNLRKLLNSQNELIIANITGGQIFVMPDEIEFLLKKRLNRAKTRLEYINAKLNAAKYTKQESITNETI